MGAAFVSAKLVSMQKYSGFSLLYQDVCENASTLVFPFGMLVIWCAGMHVLYSCSSSKQRFLIPDFACLLA